MKADSLFALASDIARASASPAPLIENGRCPSCGGALLRGDRFGYCTSCGSEVDRC